MLAKIRRWFSGPPSPVPAARGAAVGGVRSRNPRRPGVVGALATPASWPTDAEHPVLAPRLAGCRSWICQLQGVNWERIEASISDVAVIDISPDGRDANAFSPGQLERMRSKPGGGEMAVLAYLSVGAAEPWRSYWSPKWQRARPGWIEAAEGAWSGSRLVHYWDRRWRSLVCDQAGSRLEQIIATGYDGVVLGDVDAFAAWSAKGRQRAAEDMIDLVAHIGATAWKSNPSFLILPMNGEALLGSARYRAHVSAVVRDEILYRLDGTSGMTTLAPNDPATVAAIAADLSHATAAGIPVLGLEYLREQADDEARILEAAERLTAMGILPYFTTSRLDRLPPATWC